MLWREEEDMPRDLLLNISHLAGERVYYGINFSRGCGQLVASYYMMVCSVFILNNPKGGEMGKQTTNCEYKHWGSGVASVCLSCTSGFLTFWTFVLEYQVECDTAVCIRPKRKRIE